MVMVMVMVMVMMQSAECINRMLALSVPSEVIVLGTNHLAHQTIWCALCLFGVPKCFCGCFGFCYGITTVAKCIFGDCHWHKSPRTPKYLMCFVFVWCASMFCCLYFLCYCHVLSFLGIAHVIQGDWPWHKSPHREHKLNLKYWFSSSAHQ